MASKAAAEPYVTEFESRVERIDGREVVLAETYFYAESGGQPADRGTLGGVPVEDVQKVDGSVVHALAEVPPFDTGDAVTGAVDPDFRTYCMRAHTASHVLYGAGRQVLDDLGYGGFGIGDEKVRVDFATTTEIDDDLLVELERLVNRTVWDSREVTWREMDREAALADDEIAFNTKTEEGVTGLDTIRVVEVEGWDVAACGGTHVGNTREMGPVTLLDRSNPGEGLTRVEFAVGPPGIERRAEERANALQAARTADTRVADLPEMVERIKTERDDLQEELADLRGDLVDARIAELREETVRKDGAEWLVGSIAGLDANGLQDRVQELAGEAADVAVLVSEDGQYLAAGTTGEVDAGDLVAEVTDEFGGGGGGGPTVAQGGGLGADAATVVSYLRE
ncbi:hypothetical protein BRC83_06875 [Halobacteriales archaeon QS_1_68_17]|nr:MAG: hypothetical protein BRC83_06875 [Halobacteriales archaeon QS_1_68_17]